MSSVSTRLRQKFAGKLSGTGSRNDASGIATSAVQPVGVFAVLTFAFDSQETSDRGMLRPVPAWMS